MKYIFILITLLLPFSAFAAIDDFLKYNSLNANGFGSIKIGQTITEASNATGIDINKHRDYSDQDCGSYIFGKGGTLNIGKIRLLTTKGVIKRIDVWDEGVSSIFNIKLRDQFIEIHKSFVTSKTTKPNHYGGINHIHFLNSGLTLLVHTYDGIINGYAIGAEPEIFLTEGCA